MRLHMFLWTALLLPPAAQRRLAEYLSERPAIRQRTTTAGPGPSPGSRSRQ